MLTLGATGIGAGIIYAAGFIHDTGVVAAVTGIMNPGATKRDIDAPAQLEHIDLPAQLEPRIPTLPLHAMTRTEPKDTALPMLTGKHVAMNLSYPFQYEERGVAMTYFPSGHDVDPAMLHLYHLPGSNISDAGNHIMHQQYNNPESLGLQKIPLSGDRIEICDTDQDTVHGLPYQGHFKTFCNPGKGWKFERVSVCGHPAKSGQFQEDILRIGDMGVNLLVDIQKESSPGNANFQDEDG